MVELEQLEIKLEKTVKSPEWLTVEKAFKQAENILLFGNGGNMSIADHGAIDISRLTDKNAICPGSGIVCSSIIGDQGFEQWLETWVSYRFRNLDPKKTLLIGFSCSTSGPSSNSIVSALELGKKQGATSALVSATEKSNLDPDIIPVNLDVIHYHTSEILSTILFYQLIHSAGFKCPTIKQKVKD